VSVYIGTDTSEGVHIQMTLNSTSGKSHSMKLYLRLKYNFNIRNGKTGKKISKYTAWGLLH